VRDLRWTKNLDRFLISVFQFSPVSITPRLLLTHPSLTLYNHRYGQRHLKHT
jgi:hypothetical protein